MDDRAATAIRAVNARERRKERGYNGRARGRGSIWYSQINRLELIVPNCEIPLALASASASERARSRSLSRSFARGVLFSSTIAGNRPFIAD